MQRLYLRLVFSRLQKSFYLITHLRKFIYNLIKPASYRKKMKKVLEINRLKLTKKQDIFNSKIAVNYAKTMNFIR